MSIDYSKIQHTSLNNYQQVSLNGSIDTINGTVTVEHGLGYVPYARVWAEHISGELSTIVVPSARTTYHADYEPLSVTPITAIALTTTQLKITAANVVKVYYRIYLDAS